jgi:hypothetical protein
MIYLAFTINIWLERNIFLKQNQSENAEEGKTYEGKFKTVLLDAKR